MLGALIATGIFSAEDYDTPPTRTLALPLERRDAILPAKYVDELLDYRLDWKVRLDGDTIAGASVVTRSGQVVPSRVIFDDTTASFWVGGGRSENGSQIEALVTTAGGRQLSQLFIIRCL